MKRQKPGAAWFLLTLQLLLWAAWADVAAGDAVVARRSVHDVVDVSPDLASVAALAGIDLSGNNNGNDGSKASKYNNGDNSNGSKDKGNSDKNNNDNNNNKYNGKGNSNKNDGKFTILLSAGVQVSTKVITETVVESAKVTQVVTVTQEANGGGGGGGGGGSAAAEATGNSGGENSNNSNSTGNASANAEGQFNPAPASTVGVIAGGGQAAGVAQGGGNATAAAAAGSVTGAFFNPAPSSTVGVIAGGNAAQPGVTVVPPAASAQPAAAQPAAAQPAAQAESGCNCICNCAAGGFGTPLASAAANPAFSLQSQGAMGSGPSFNPQPSTTYFVGASAAAGAPASPVSAAPALQPLSSSSSSSSPPPPAAPTAVTTVPAPAAGQLQSQIAGSSESLASASSSAELQNNRLPFNPSTISFQSAVTVNLGARDVPVKARATPGP